jgi:hypothetical protein
MDPKSKMFNVDTQFAQTIRQGHLCVAGASNDRQLFTLISR